MSFESKANIFGEEIPQLDQSIQEEKVDSFYESEENSPEIDIREILKDGFDDNENDDIIELNSNDDIKKFQEAYGVDIKTILEQKHRQ